MKIKYFPEILNYVSHDLTLCGGKKKKSFSFLVYTGTNHHQILNCLFTTLYMCTQSATQINVIHRCRKSLVGKNAYTTSVSKRAIILTHTRILYAHLYIKPVKCE